MSIELICDIWARRCCSEELAAVQAIATLRSISDVTAKAVTCRLRTYLVQAGASKKTNDKTSQIQIKIRRTCYRALASKSQSSPTRRGSSSCGQRPAPACAVTRGPGTSTPGRSWCCNVTASENVCYVVEVITGATNAEKASQEGARPSSIGHRGGAPDRLRRRRYGDG